MPAVSIVVPVYNAEKYIENCIDSILAQSFTDFELILVDDGSFDMSGKICDDYALKDKRVIPLHLKNGGVSAARNAGINCASGEFLMFCDSDDYVKENWISSLYGCAAKSPYSMAFCGYNVHDLRQNNERVRSVAPKKQSYPKSDFYEICLETLFYVVWNKIFSLKIIKENNIKFDESISLGEDLLFCLDYLKCAGNKILAVSGCEYQYILRNAESLNFKYYENLWDINIKLYSSIYRCMIEFGADIKKYSEDFYFVYLRALTNTLQNTMSAENKNGYFAKIKYNSCLMQSDIYKECLKKAGKGEYSRFFLMWLKTGRYSFVILYKYLCRIKEFPIKVKDKLKLIFKSI